jgi:GNAT superfamily N-acetyltransferase
VNRLEATRPGRRTAAIRPVRPADLPALGAFFEDLSVESRFLRFFAPVRPTGSLLRRLSGEHANVDALVAVADGVIVGHVMATDRIQVRTLEDPCPAGVTDVGVVVADAWQRRGVGAALMRALVARAQARGVTTLAMDVLPSNGRVLAMIIGHWPEAVIRQTPDSLDIRIPLPQPRVRHAHMVRPLASVGAVSLLGRVRRDAGAHREHARSHKHPGIWSNALRIIRIGSASTWAELVRSGTGSTRVHRAGLPHGLRQRLPLPRCPGSGVRSLRAVGPAVTPPRCVASRCRPVDPRAGLPPNVV